MGNAGRPPHALLEFRLRRREEATCKFSKSGPRVRLGSIRHVELRSRSLVGLRRVTRGETDLERWVKRT